jgi:hypothetical protein
MCIERRANKSHKEREVLEQFDVIIFFSWLRQGKAIREPIFIRDMSGSSSSL